MTPEQAKALIDDYHFMRDNGESHEAAARRLGCSVKTLDKKLTRARKRLAMEAGMGVWNARKSLERETIKGHNSIQQSGPTGDSDISNRASHSMRTQRAG